MFLSHLHAWPDGESVREARPDAASGRLPWPLCEALLQPAWQVPPPTPREDREPMTSWSWLWQRRGVSSGHAAGRSREMWAGAQKTWFGTPFLIPNGSVF